MLCPICKVELVLSERQGIEIDYCPRCRGVWLDRGELDKIIERANASLDGSTAMPLISAPDGRKRKVDYPDDELPYDYDAGARYEDRPRRYEEKRRRKSFLDDVFDIFD